MSTINALLSLALAAAPLFDTLGRAQRERALFVKDSKLLTALDSTGPAHAKLKAHVEARVSALVDRESYGITWRHAESAKAAALAVLAIFLLVLALAQPSG